MSKPYRIGVIGAGYVARRFHLPILHNIDNVKVEYIADLNMNRAKKLGEIYDARTEQISDRGMPPTNCDIALLAIPVGARGEYIDWFSSKGIPIFTEKPFATDYETHQHFLSGSSIISCNYMRVNYSATRAMKRLVESEIFGQLNKVNIIDSNTGSTGLSKGTYHTDTDLSGGGILLETGCHTVSQLVKIFEDHEISVNKASVTFQDDIDVNINTKISIDHRIDVFYRLSRIDLMKTQAIFEFENAIVKFEHPNPEAKLLIYKNKNKPIFRLADDSWWAKTRNEAVYLKWRQFLTSLEDNGYFDSAEQTSLETTRIISKIIKMSENE